MVIPEAKGYDKAWLFKVEPDTTGGLSIVGREFDAATAQIGLVCRRPAPVLADGPRALLQLSLDVFAPSGEIAEAAAGKQRVKVQGAMLPAADPIGQVASAGTAFRPLRIFYKPDGGIAKLAPITRTYLRVDSIEGGMATCSVYSALGNPFTKNVAGKAKMVAVGVKPTAIPTKLRFVTPKPEQLPLAGYDVIARPAPDGTPRQVGTTDREGRIVLEPGFSSGLVILRLMAAGIEPLVQFPLMPGEQVEERVIDGVDPRPLAVTTESELQGLQSEIVDLIAVRHRLLLRLKSRADASQWDEVKRILEEYKTLTPREVYDKQIAKLDSELATQQQNDKRHQIRTGTAQRLITETKGLVDRYLDDDEFAAYQDALERYNLQNSTKTTKALPKAPPLPMGGAVKKSAGGLVDLSPPGAGFTVVLPGAPSEEKSKTPDGSSEITTYRYTDKGKGLMFVVAYRDYPLAVTSDDTSRVLDSERDRILASLPGSKVVREKTINAGGVEGKEVEFEVAGARGATAGYLSRILLVNSRIMAAAVGGNKEAVASKPATDFLDSFRPTVRGGTAPPAAAAPPDKSGPAPSAPKASGTPKKREQAPSPASRPKSPGGATPF